MSTTSDPSTEAAAKFIPLSVPHITGNEWQYVKECLDTGWVSSVGSFVNRFEQQLAEYVGARYAVATTSGTAALHIALLVCGVEPSDEVLVPTLTFIASANAVRYAGAHPVLIDAEPQFWQLDANLVEDFVSDGCDWQSGALRNKRTGRRVKAIMPVHVLGHPVDMDPVLDVARQFDLAVIEDAAESLGARYKGQMAGNLGHVGCFSFNGNKTITTGGGGMLVTNNKTLADRARYLTTQAKDDPQEYVHHEIGFNYRLSNLLAAVGCAQLECLPKFLEAKRRHAAHYSRKLSDIRGIKVLEESSFADSSHWLSAIQVDESQFGMSSRQLREFLAQRRIDSRPLWQPLHLSRSHQDAPAIVNGMAEALFENCLCLPSSADLSEDDCDRVIVEIERARLRG